MAGVREGYAPGCDTADLSYREIATYIGSRLATVQLTAAALANAGTGHFAQCWVEVLAIR